MGTCYNEKCVWLDEKCTKSKYGKNNKKTTIYLKDLSNVLVIEERSKRVKILGKNNVVGWISRYYLDKEIVTNDTQDKLNLCEQAIKNAQKILSENQDNLTAQNLFTTLGKLNLLLRE